MRVAQLVGLSPDGRFVIVATERGEEMAIAADDRLRAALRGGPAASEKLEIEMESALSPREIQTRIRSGESVDDVARVAGIERDRVERFAAPVIAEREHVAGLAMAASARRRGETSSHRTLRGVLNERLLNRGVDSATVRWDSYRLDDGRWAVTADYLSGETQRQALFYFDLPGRYSVAGNDEGRWVLGDSSPSRGPQPGRLPPGQGEPDDTEPTLDLSDELALVRAIQEIPTAGASDSEAGAAGEDTGLEVTETEIRIAEVVQFTRASDAPAEQVDLDTELAEVEAELDRLEEEERSGSGLNALYEIFEEQDPPSAVAEPESTPVEDLADPESAEPTVVVDRDREESEADASGQADAAGEAGMSDEADAARLGDSAPSDASAVPELRVPLLSDAWEPAIVVNYPIEPSSESSEGDGVEVPEGSDEPGRPEAAVARDDRRDEADAAFALADSALVDEAEETHAAENAPVVESSAPSKDAPEPASSASDAADPESSASVEDPPKADPSAPTETAPAETAPLDTSRDEPSASVAAGRTAAKTDQPEDEPLPLDLPEQPTPPPTPKPTRRKRASVPSWDEIVFGGPKDS